MPLLETLKLYQVETTKISEAKNKLEAIKTGGLIRGILFSIFMGLIGIPLLAALVLKVMNGKVDTEIMMEVNVISMLLVPILIIFTVIRVGRKKRVGKALRAQYFQIIGESQGNMLAMGEVPEFYHNSHAINSFIHYLESFQAETLQECARLFNQDEKHRESINAMDLIAYEVSESNDRMAALERQERKQTRIMKRQ